MVTRRDISKMFQDRLQSLPVAIEEWHINQKGQGETLAVKALGYYVRVIYYERKQGLFIIVHNLNGKSEEQRCFVNNIVSWLEYDIKLLKSKVLSYEPVKSTKQKEEKSLCTQYTFDFSHDRIIEEEYQPKVKSKSR